MISCAEREELREKTAEALRATDWGERPVVVLDESTFERKQDRQSFNSLQALRRAVADGVDFLLFLEDDLEFNAHIRRNLEEWEPLRGVTGDDPFFASLYNPNIGELERHPTGNYFVADPESVYGSQAYLLSSATARYFVEHWGEVEGMQDIQMSRMAGRLGKIFYHTPSLVQHVGHQSVWGGGFHWAPDYDASWRAGERWADPIYTQEYLDGVDGGSLSSAEVVVPVVLEYVRPQSVVDFGCGKGAWLSVFRKHGVAEVLGVDGAPLHPASLWIPQDQFLRLDIRRPAFLPESYDLAVCLEIAEHLPAESADGLVEALTKAAPVVLFSAAIPGQGGHGHINEQWPEYWAERFAAQGYVAVDCLRRRIWTDGRVCFWYRQNLLLFVREESADDYPALREFLDAVPGEALSLVHPELYGMRAGGLI